MAGGFAHVLNVHPGISYTTDSALFKFNSDRYLFVFMVIEAIQALRYLQSATPAILPGNANQIIAIICSRVGASTAIDSDGVSWAYRIRKRRAKAPIFLRTTNGASI